MISNKDKLKLESTSQEPERLTDGLRARMDLLGVPKAWFYALSLISLIVIAILAFFLVSAHSQLGKLKEDVNLQQADPGARVREETNLLVDEVGKLIVLPQDESPTIATVTDLEKLKSQPFFANAQIGDKVLIYARAQKAILYRPDQNKIIELAPLNTEIQQ